MTITELRTFIREVVNTHRARGVRTFLVTAHNSESGDKWEEVVEAENSNEATKKADSLHPKGPEASALVRVGQDFGKLYGEFKKKQDAERYNFIRFHALSHEDEFI